MRIRILSKSETPECEFRGILIANGNNLTITGDMTRRVLLAKLDAGVEPPEDREFKFDPVKLILRGRGKYVAAGMTIVRAYLASGQPGKLKPLASYGAWSDLVCSARHGVSVPFGCCAVTVDAGPLPDAVTRYAARAAMAVAK